MPLFWLALAFLGGILLAKSVSLTAAVWLILAGVFLGASILTAVLSRRLGQRSGMASPGNIPPSWLQRLPYPFSPAFFGLILAFVCFGAARFSSTQPDFNDPGMVAGYNDLDEKVVLEGVVVEPPVPGDTSTSLRISARRIRLAHDSLFHFYGVRGLILVDVPPGETWRYGDGIRLEGKLETPFEVEGFSYREFLARQGVYSSMRPVKVNRLGHEQGNPIWALVYRIKARALDTVDTIFPDPEASLLAGILLGVESGIPDDLQAAFNATGTSHIIAISGFNIGIIAGLFTLSFTRLLGRKWGTLAAILGIVLYTMLVGASPSVLRAAIMGGFALFARQVGRQTGLNILAITAAVMVGITPSALMDPGFQLSFAATLGLVLYASPLQTWAKDLLARKLPLDKARWIASLMANYILFTLVAQALTLPVTAYHFQRISLVSLLANPIILPAQPPVMILGGLAVLLWMAWQPLGQLVAYLAWPFVAFTIRAVEWLAGLPNASLALGSVTMIVVIGIYLLIFALTVWKARFGKSLATWVPVGALIILGLAVGFTWREAFLAPDGRLHVTILEVNPDSLSGDGVLVQTPSGRNLLIDGGPSATRLSDALGRRLPLTNRSLDWLVVAFPGKNQTVSLPAVLARFPAAYVAWAGPTHGTPADRALQEELARLGVLPVMVKPGQVFDLGQGVTLRVLTVGSRGASLLLEWERFRMLLPLGANIEDIESLESRISIGRVSALLLGDSGYAPSNPPEWIANLQPQVVLLSVAAADKEGLPSSETLELLQGYNILRTDRNGWIELTTDGERMWVDVEKK